MRVDTPKGVIELRSERYGKTVVRLGDGFLLSDAGKSGRDPEYPRVSGRRDQTSPRVKKRRARLFLGIALPLFLVCCGPGSLDPEPTRSPRPGTYWECGLEGGGPYNDPDEVCVELPTEEMRRWIFDPCWYVPPEEGTMTDEECVAYFGGIPPFEPFWRSPVPPPP